MAVQTIEASSQVIRELVDRHRALYASAGIERKLQAIIRDAPMSKLSAWDVHRILRTAQAVFFDTHVEVVSGHHTATYLRFASIASIPQLIRLIARDVADWIRQHYAADLPHAPLREPLAGILTTASEAQRLADAVAEVLRGQMDLRVVATPYDHATGRIGTDVAAGAIQHGEGFIVLNDVTTRGNCVGKLGRVVTDQGGVIAGMAVFARRDSGQFPAMDELTKQYRVYFTANLDMPQWEPEQCPLCHKKEPLLSWKDVPEL